MNLKGKNIIVTGGSLGIGKEIAKALVDKGANVLITGRSEERLLKAKIRISIYKKEIEECFNKNIISSDLIELRNLICVAEIIIISALTRKESRGLHYNIDYPKCFS